jgi:hypothetical protein
MKNETGILRNFTDGDRALLEIVLACMHSASAFGVGLTCGSCVSCVVLKRKTWEKYSVGVAFDFWPGFLYWANRPDYEIQTPPN